MNRDVLSHRTLLLAAFGLFLLLPAEMSLGHPAWTNGWHLNCPLQAGSNAELVCKIQVLSTRRAEIIKKYLPGGKADPSRMLARSKVLSVIKGECKPAIDIEFDDQRSRTAGFSPSGRGTELTKGEVCIVFLKHQEGRYVLNRIRSKLRVRPEVVDYNLGDTPNLRLLAEMLAGCDSKNEMVQLQAVEELGYLSKAMFRELRPFKGDRELFEKMAFGLIRTKEALQRMRRSENQMIRGMSIISSFWADDSPGIEGPLELLRMNPSDFDKDDSLRKYGTWGFCVSDLQLRLLETMDSATRRAVVDLKDGSVIRREDGNLGMYRGVRGFDYAEFYRQALDCDAVRKNEQMRGAIANVIWIRYEKRSVPLMVQLLDDSNLYVRFVAVGSLMKYTGEGPKRSSWEEFGERNQKYVEYWKGWWSKNKARFRAPQKMNHGID